MSEAYENDDLRRPLLIFGVGGQTFACEFCDIIKIEPTDGTVTTPAPGFPAYMPGTVKLDSGIAPVIDASKRFGGSGITGVHSCFIVTGLSPSEAESAKFERYDRCAVMVDEVYGSEVVGNLMPAPAVNADSYARYMKGVYSKDGEIIYVISPDKLVGE